MTHDDFLEFIKEQGDDIETFVDYNTSEITELFETGSVTIGYCRSNEKPRELEISLKIKEIVNSNAFALKERCSNSSRLAAEISELLKKHHDRLSLAEVLGVFEIIKDQLIKDA